MSTSLSDLLSSGVQGLRGPALGGFGPGTPPAAQKSSGRGFLDFLFGEGEKTEQFQRFTPDQQDVLNRILGGAAGQLPSGLDFISSILGQDPEAMQRFQAPARRAFEEETIPSIAERFTGALGEGGQRSSAFGQQLGKAASGLEEQLAAQRSGLGFQALQQLQSLLGAGLTPQFEQMYRPRQPGALEEFGTAALGGLGSILPFLFI